MEIILELRMSRTFEMFAIIVMQQINKIYVYGFFL